MKTKEIEIILELNGVMTVIMIQFEEAITYSKVPKVFVTCNGEEPSIGFIEVKQVKNKIPVQNSLKDLSS